MCFPHIQKKKHTSFYNIFHIVILRLFFNFYYLKSGTLLSILIDPKVDIAANINF